MTKITKHLKIVYYYYDIVSDHVNHHELPFDIPIIINSDVDSLVDRAFTREDIQTLKQQNPIFFRLINRSLERISPQDIPKKTEILQLVTDILRLCGSAANRAALEEDFLIKYGEYTTPDQTPPTNS